MCTNVNLCAYLYTNSLVCVIKCVYYSSKTQTTDRNTIMKEQNKKNKLDELEKEINLLNERVKKIEASFNVKEIEEKPKTSFM